MSCVCEASSAEGSAVLSLRSRKWQRDLDGVYHLACVTALVCHGGEVQTQGESPRVESRKKVRKDEQKQAGGHVYSGDLWWVCCSAQFQESD